jgi:hypothetical protein
MGLVLSQMSSGPSHSETNISQVLFILLAKYHFEDKLNEYKMGGVCGSFLYSYTHSTVSSALANNSKKHDQSQL